MTTYTFGNMKHRGQYVEVVKTISDTKHTNLLGFCHVIENNVDCTIINDFRIIEKFQSDEENEKYCDWYVIDCHRIEKDYFRVAQPAINKGISDVQDAACELSEITEESVAALEQAICDLSEEISGGKNNG